MLAGHIFDVEYSRITAPEVIEEVQANDLVVGSYYDFNAAPSKEEIAAHLEDVIRPGADDSQSCSYAELPRGCTNGHECQPYRNTEIVPAKYGDIDGQLGYGKPTRRRDIRVVCNLRHYWAGIRSRTVAH